MYKLYCDHFHQIYEVYYITPPFVIAEDEDLDVVVEKTEAYTDEPYFIDFKDGKYSAYIELEDELVLLTDSYKGALVGFKREAG